MGLLPWGLPKTNTQAVLTQPLLTEHEAQASAVRSPSLTGTPTALGSASFIKETRDPGMSSSAFTFTLFQSWVPQHYLRSFLLVFSWCALNFCFGCVCLSVFNGKGAGKFVINWTLSHKKKRSFLFWLRIFIECRSEVEAAEPVNSETSTEQWVRSRCLGLILFLFPPSLTFCLLHFLSHTNIQTLGEFSYTLTP